MPPAFFKLDRPRPTRTHIHTEGGAEMDGSGSSLLGALLASNEEDGDGDGEATIPLEEEQYEQQQSVQQRWSLGSGSGSGRRWEEIEEERDEEWDEEEENGMGGPAALDPPPAPVPATNPFDDNGDDVAIAAPAVGDACPRRSLSLPTDAPAAAGAGAGAETAAAAAGVVRRAAVITALVKEVSLGVGGWGFGLLSSDMCLIHLILQTRSRPAA